MTIDDLLQQGIAVFKTGQKTEARDLLLQVVEQDERNEMAWLWLSGAVDTDAERLTCLENVLAINPNNGMAKRGVETLRKSSPGLVSADVPSRKDEVAVQPTEEPRTSVEFQSATPDEINNILQQAVTAIKSGEKEKGKELLVEVLELDENNEAAWLWMTRCVDDRDTKRECFERVLEINPDNQHAIKGLKRLNVSSKVETSTSPKHKAAEKQTRLIVGIVAGTLIVAVALVGIWWVTSGGSSQSGPEATAAVAITQVSTTEELISVPVSGPTGIPTWTPLPAPIDPTDAPVPTALTDTPILGDPQAFVLTLTDMPTGFSIVPENTGYWSNEYIAEQRENPADFLAQLEEWGRINGYSVGYGKPGFFGTTYVESSVIIIKTSDGAHDYYEHLVNEDLRDGWTPVSMPTLADESYALTLTDTGGTFYDVIFRKRNVIGIVLTGAKPGTAVFDDARNFVRVLESCISDTPPTGIPTMPPIATRPRPTQTPAPTQTPTPFVIPMNETQTLGPIWNSLRDESYTAQISLHEVRFHSGSEYAKPKQGYVYVIVDVTVKNLGPDLMRSVSSYGNFQIRDANGALRDTALVVPGVIDCQLEPVDLTPNGSVSGCVGFEVPMTGTLELIYAPYQYEGLEPGRYLSFTIQQ